MRLFFVNAVLVLFVISSCNRPECTNNRAIFNEYQPADFECQRELARLIDSIGKDNLTYWVKDFYKSGEKEFMELYVQSDAVCAIAVFDVTSSSGVQQLKKVEGMGYSGAELRRVNYTVHQQDSSIAFVMDDVGDVID